MNNDPIGVLDSGVGGLSIWRAIVKKLPNESFIYVADSINCPYGSKSSEEVYRLTRKLVRFLLSKKVKLIVLACNTITVSCIDKLRKDFPKVPIIGTVPVIKTSVSRTKNRKIGILSTKQTAKSKYQKDLIERFGKGLEVLNLGTNDLVPLVEEGEIGGQAINKILKKIFKPFVEFNIDVLALGCSHFPFLRKQMQKILGKKVLILDSGAAIGRQVKRILLANKNLSPHKKPLYLFYTTGDSKKFREVAKMLLGLKYGKIINRVERISL